MFIQNSFPITTPMYPRKPLTISKCSSVQINCNLARGHIGGCKSCPAAANCRKQSVNGKAFGKVFEERRGRLDIRV